MAIVFILVVIKMVKFGGFFFVFFSPKFFSPFVILFFFETKHQRKEYYTI